MHWPDLALNKFAPLTYVLTQGQYTPNILLIEYDYCMSRYTTVFSVCTQPCIRSQSPALGLHIITSCFRLVLFLMRDMFMYDMGGADNVN